MSTNETKQIPVVKAVANRDELIDEIIATLGANHRALRQIRNAK